MRKILAILLCIVLLSGCGKKEEEVKVQYDTTYYEVASPYKEPIGSYSLRSFDKNEVETMLMNISMQYFKPNNSLYQNGQYLTTEDMKDLLSEEKLNKKEPITVDGIEITPSFISAIYEQNYLATNGNLKGVSVALIVDPKQSYQHNGKTLYKMVDENIALNVAKQKALELIKHMRSKEEIKDKKIIIGLYLESNSGLKGAFQYVGVSENGDIAWQHKAYHYELLDGNKVMNGDMKTYNAYLALKREFSAFSDVYVNAIGFYQEDQLLNVQITFQSNDFSQSKILNISKKVSTAITSFEHVSVKVSLKSNQVTKAFFIKKENSNELETYILEG